MDRSAEQEDNININITGRTSAVVSPSGLRRDNRVARDSRVRVEAQGEHFAARAGHGIDGSQSGVHVRVLARCQT